ncbi:hypothetical protein [Pseudalkalibacillus sp. R45]|uniref:hypothetical protein n=1 Tax=Pseudalkalibacillus sp. R45 TaxID=3457433 RepID=UPI003FCD166B
MIQSQGGTFHILDLKNGLYIKSKDIGLLQTYEGWASFTGTAKMNAETAPVLIKMDEENPFTSKQTIDIRVGEHHYEGELKGRWIFDRTTGNEYRTKRDHSRRMVSLLRVCTGTLVLKSRKRWTSVSMS